MSCEGYGHPWQVQGAVLRGQSQKLIGFVIPCAQLQNEEGTGGGHTVAVGVRQGSQGGGAGEAQAGELSPKRSCWHPGMVTRWQGTRGCAAPTCPSEARFLAGTRREEWRAQGSSSSPLPTQLILQKKEPTTPTSTSGARKRGTSASATSGFREPGILRRDPAAAASHFPHPRTVTGRERWPVFASMLCSPSAAVPTDPLSHSSIS